MPAIAVNYTIYIPDAARVATFQAQYPNGIQISPNAAASAYGVPTSEDGLQHLSSQGGIAIVPPDGYWINNGTFWHAYLGTESFSYTFTDQYPWPTGWGPSPYPLTLQFYWVGEFQACGAPGAPTTTPHYLGDRLWVDGFESPTFGDGGSGSGLHAGRDASRTTEGLGFAYRANNNSGKTHTPPAGNRITWERLYIRLRKLPSGGDDNFWFTHGNGAAGASHLLNVNTNGTLSGYFKGNVAYPGQLAGTTAPLTVGTWYRLDIRHEFVVTASAPPNVKLQVYVNGVLAINGTGTNPPANQTHVDSTVGADVSSTSHGAELDLDDWIAAKEVVNGAGTFPGHDLTCGSHISLVRPIGFTAGVHQTANWEGVGAGIPGDWRQVNSMPGNPFSGQNGLTTVTTGAVLAVDTDFNAVQYGCAAMAVGAYPAVATGGTGQIGVVGTGVNSVQNITVTQGIWTAREVTYTVPNGTTVDAIPAIGPVSLRFITPAGLHQMQALLATAEMIGVFGSEDLDPAHPTTMAFVRAGIHNAPYPSLLVNQTKDAPVAAVRIAAGTYTGNRIGQDVLSKINAHWWWVRPLSGSDLGVAWYSSMLCGHTWLSQKMLAENMAQATVATAMQVAGVSANCNSPGTNYQYIGISDLAMRFILNGAFAHSNLLGSALNNLIDPAFQADAGFLFIEDHASASSGQYYKGPGHTTDRASLLNAADVAGIATFGLGSLTSKQAVHTDNPSTAFSLWRKNDGSGTTPWWDAVSYVGNGAGGNRDIALALGGRGPLFALVVPHDGTSYVRDPSHAGLNSTLINSGASTTAIVGGGANKITVSTSLNANGVVYDVFVIGGDFSGGWSGNALAVLATEAPRTGGPWSPSPPAVPNDVPGSGCRLAP